MVPVHACRSGTCLQSRVSDLCYQTGQLVTRIRAARERLDAVKPAFQAAKSEFACARQAFLSAKAEHERAQTEFKRAKAEFDSCAQAFQARLDELKSASRKQREDKKSIARLEFRFNTRTTSGSRQIQTATPTSTSVVLASPMVLVSDTTSWIETEL